MPFPASLRLPYTLLGIVCALTALPAGAAPPYAGRPVQEVLDELRSEGVTFIYNTTLVPPELTVLEEPDARTPIALAAQVLAQHGLEVLRVAPGSYAVVRGHPPPPAAARDEPRPPTPRMPPRKIEEIVVTTSRYSLGSRQTEPSTLISQHDIGALPRLGDETLRAVQRLPGAASNGLSGLAAMRGGDPNETLILLDGMQLFEPFHLKNFFSPVSLLDSRIVSELDVYSGGFGARYGTRISAVTDARSIEPAASRYYELGASLFHTNALTAQRFARGDGQWLLSARRSNLDEIIHILDSDFGEPQYFDAFTRLHYDLAPATRISASYLGSRDTIEARRTSRAELADAEYRNNYGWLTLDHEWSDRATTRLLASFTDVTNERSGRIDSPGRIAGIVEDDRFFHVAGLQLEGTYRTGSVLHVWGLSARRLSASYEYDSDVRFEADYPFPGSPGMQTTRSARLRPDGDEYAAFWSSRIPLTPRFTLEAGLRWDDETYTGADSGTQLAPRLSALYVLPAGQRLRFSWGRYFQSQAINEAQVESELELFSPAQRAEQVVLSFETELATGARLRIEAYRKNYSRLRPRWENLFDTLVLVPELKPDRVLIEPDSARIDGIELLLSRRIGAPWTWWLGYTWSQARDRIDGREIPRSWDQRHAITAGLHWANERWDVTLADTYHTGWPTTPVRVEGVGPTATVSIGERNSARFDDFNSTDFRINRRVLLAHGELDLFLEVANLFNERNPCCQSISASRTPSGIVLDREIEHWLGIVPSVGVLWRY